MDDLYNSYTVTLQENVPLSEADNILVKKMTKAQKANYVYLTLLAIFFITMVMSYFLPSKTNLILGVRPSYLPKISTLLLIFVTINLLLWLINWKQIANDRKDARRGKSIISGMLVHKVLHSGNVAYFHFVEPLMRPIIKMGVDNIEYIRYQEVRTGVTGTDNPRYQIIKILVTKTDYIRYKVGATLTVSFLPTNRVAIEIVAQ